LFFSLETPEVIETHFILTTDTNGIGEYLAQNPYRTAIPQQPDVRVCHWIFPCGMFNQRQA
jgi:hypothetical protein